MKQFKQLTCIIEREGDSYVSLCPQIDIASQGNSVEEARKNLVEAIELFFEMASPNEILARVYSEIYVTQIGVAIG
jgi:predicted RNase H-like HicB family nuclease